jgi:hypothetical protein
MVLVVSRRVAGLLRAAISGGGRGNAPNVALGGV